LHHPHLWFSFPLYLLQGRFAQALVSLSLNIT
jgi:hypothetical protein